MASKKQQTRMGAVFDHLCPLGFSKSLIRKKINLLLKVYGDEGWVFFEEDSYKLLIEAILEEQEELPMKDCSMEIGAASTSSQQPNQIAVIEHACIEPEPNKEPVSQSVVMDAEMGGRRWEDLPEDILVSIFIKGLHEDELEFVVPVVCSSWRRASRHPMCQRVIDGYDNVFAKMDLSYVFDCFASSMKSWREFDQRMQELEKMRELEDCERILQIAMVRKSLTPRLICLSMEGAPSVMKTLLEDGSHSTGNGEFFTLLETFAGSFGLTFNAAVNQIVGMSSGQDFSQVLHSDTVDWMNFAVFWNAWRLSTKEGCSQDDWLSSSWKTVNGVIQKLVDKMRSMNISSSYVSLSTLIQMVTEPVAWHIVVLKSCVRFYISKYWFNWDDSEFLISEYGFHSDGSIRISV